MQHIHNWFYAEPNFRLALSNLDAAHFGDAQKATMPFGELGLPDSLPAYRVLHGLSGTSPQRRSGKIVVNGT